MSNDLSDCRYCHKASDNISVYAKCFHRKWRGFAKCNYCGEFVYTIAVYWAEEEAIDAARRIWNRKNR